MAAVLTVDAVEGSTYIVTAAFTNEDGDAVVPNNIAWTLTDAGGDVVNSREDVSETPASSVDIVLHGNDLVADPSGGGYLLITVEADYDSVLGSGLELVGQARVPVVQQEP